ncbi:MAG: phosphatidate cytidylyltransferase [Geminicoccaceae bacterium]
MAQALAEGLDPALRKRVISAALLAALVICDVLLGGWFFAALVIAACIVMADEWMGLGPNLRRDMRMLVMFLFVAKAAGVILATASGHPDVAVLWLAVAVVLSAGAAAAVGHGSPDHVAGGLLYVAIPALALIWLRNQPDVGLPAVLWLFMVVWATDTFAYVFGRWLGGPKLAPQISPSKTWSGLIGGMAGAVAVGTVFAWFLQGRLVDAALAAMVLAVVAQAGDLFESFMKRRAGVKDSGSIIPGHGGILDRVDGLMFAAPVYAIFVLLTGKGSIP